MLVGYSKIGTSVIVEHVQHAGIVRAFSVPGGQIKLLGCGFTKGDQCPGWHYGEVVYI